MESKLKRVIGEDLARIKRHMDIDYGFDIFSRSRKRNIIDARRVFVALIHSKYKIGPNSENYYSRKLTLKMLGDFMKFHHATIIHFKKTYDSLAPNTPELVEKFNQFSSILPEEFDIKIDDLLSEKDTLINRIQDINFEITEIIKDEKENEDYYIHPA